MISKVTFKIQKRFARWKNDQAKQREEKFNLSLNQVQRSYFVKIRDILSDYQKCICYKQDNVIIIEIDQYRFKRFCSIAIYASECRVLFTDISKIANTDSKIVKHTETKYFNDDAGFIFDFLLDECLKKKRRDHENKRNDLIS